jgi:hypothetical protein
MNAGEISKFQGGEEKGGLFSLSAVMAMDNC